MDDHLLEPLRAARTAIRREWETLLRTEPVVTPLADPDLLSHMIDRTLDEVLGALSPSHPSHRPVRPTSYASIRDQCDCGRNPLLAYFLAGERALLEKLILVQAGLRDLAPEKRDKAVTEVYLVLHKIARRDITGFCSVCQHRGSEAHGPHAALASRR